MKELQHGHRAKGQESPTYQSWKAMLKRCRNPNHKSYPIYGGRGVTVCDRWDPAKGGSFENFLADMGERPIGKTLDKDIKGDGMIYSPETCCWASRPEQAKHRRKPKGDRKTLRQMAIESGLSPHTIRTRLELGWSLEAALSTPPRPQGLSAAARAAGLNPNTVHTRIQSGMTLHDALTTPVRRSKAQP
jgi:lambda repressor-like predicted transcriptional regulator